MKKNLLFLSQWLKTLALLLTFFTLGGCEDDKIPEEPQNNPISVEATMPAFVSAEGETVAIQWLKNDSFTLNENIVMTLKSENKFVNETEEIAEGANCTALYQHFDSESHDPANYSFTDNGNSKENLNNLIEMTANFSYEEDAKVVFEHSFALVEINFETEAAPKSLEYNDGTTTAAVEFSEVEAGANSLYVVVKPTEAASDITINIVDENDNKTSKLFEDFSAIEKGKLYTFNCIEEAASIKTTVEPSDNSAVISTTPTDGVGAYMIANMTYEEFEMAGGEADPDYFISTYIKRFINYGGDPTKVDNLNVFEGNVDLNPTGLLPSTDYMVVTFAANAEGELTSEVTYTEYSTLDYIEPEAELESVKITGITPQNATVTIKVGDYAGNYFSRLCDKNDYESFYQNDPVKAATSMVANAVAKGVDLSTPDGKYIWNGDASYELEDIYPGLMPNVEYFILTFGVDSEGVITTKIEENAFATPEAEEKITNIAINVSEVTNSSAFIEFTPDVNGVAYYATVFEESYLAGLSDEEIIAKLSSEDNFSGSVRTYPVSNTISELQEGAKYQAIAFGYDEEKEEATTEIFDVIFSTTTSGGGEVTLPTSITLATAEFGDITFSDNTDPSFNFNVIPNDKNMKYIVVNSFAGTGVYTPEELEGKTDEEIILGDLTVLAQAAAEYGLSFSEALNNPMATKVGDWSNVYGPKVDGQTYVVLAYGIDVTTAQPVTKLQRGEYTVGGGTSGGDTELTLPTSITLATAEFGDITFSDNSDASFDFNVIPNDKNMKYVVVNSFAGTGVYTPAELEGKTDEEIILGDLTVLAQAAAEYGLSFEDALTNPMATKSGDWSNVYGPKVDGQTYVVLAYGIDLKTAQPVTKLHRAEYTVGGGTSGGGSGEPTLPESITLATAEFGEVTFSNNTDASFDFKVIPNDKNMRYVVVNSFVGSGVYTPDQLEGLSDEEIILSDLTTVAQAAEEYGLSFKDAITNPMVSKQGDWGNVYGPKKEGQTYVVLVYGIDLTTVQPVTKLHRAEYTVPASN